MVSLRHSRRKSMGALPLELVILAIVAFLVGALLMWLVNYISRGQSRQQSRATARLEGANATDEQELLCVLRTEKGPPDVLVQGRRYRHLRDITNPQVGYETVEALKAVMEFAEGWLPEPQPVPQPPLPEPALTGEPAVPSEPPADRATFLKQLRERNPFTAPQLSRMVPPSRRPRSDALPPLVPPADQINNLIQRRLRKQPDLVDQKIRLVTGPDGGLIIHVGLQTFHTVAGITDPRARALVQDAIREWENSY
jgi:hypothetical protein